MKVSEISILGRATQGVTLMRMSEGNNVVSMARMINEECPEGVDCDDTEGESAEDTSENEV
jgi:DNA gyrase subunit A